MDAPAKKELNPAELPLLIAQQLGVYADPPESVGEITERIHCVCDDSDRADLSLKLSHKGVMYCCFHCGVKGGMRLGNNHNNEAGDWAMNKTRFVGQKAGTQREIKRPKRIQPWGSDSRVIDMLEGRGLPLEVLNRRFGVFFRESGMLVVSRNKQTGERIEDFRNALIFPYYHWNGSGLIIGYKKRSVSFDETTGQLLPKAYTQAKDSQKTLYNDWGLIKSSNWQKDGLLIITEGEFDCQSIVIGGRLCCVVSMPGGANKGDNHTSAEIFLQDYYSWIMDGVKRVILAGDVEPSLTGRKLMSAIGDVFGREICSIVERWEGDAKDANECFQLGGGEAVRQSLRNATPLLEADKTLPPEMLNPPKPKRIPVADMHPMNRAMNTFPPSGASQ